MIQVNCFLDKGRKAYFYRSFIRNFDVKPWVFENDITCGVPSV